MATRKKKRKTLRDRRTREKEAAEREAAERAVFGTDFAQPEVTEEDTAPDVRTLAERRAFGLPETGEPTPKDERLAAEEAAFGVPAGPDRFVTGPAERGIEPFQPEEPDAGPGLARRTLGGIREFFASNRAKKEAAEEARRLATSKRNLQAGKAIFESLLAQGKIADIQDKGQKEAFMSKLGEKVSTSVLKELQPERTFAESSKAFKNIEDLAKNPSNSIADIATIMERDLGFDRTKAFSSAQGAVKGFEDIRRKEVEGRTARVKERKERFQTEMAELQLELKRNPKPPQSVENAVAELRGVSTSVRFIAKTVEDMISAGTPPGRMAGILSSVKRAAGFAPEVDVFQGLTEIIKGPIAKALGGESGRLTDQDIQRAGKIVPNILDSPEIISAKLSAIQELIARRVNAVRGGAVTLQRGGIEFTLSGGLRSKESFYRDLGERFPDMKEDVAAELARQAIEAGKVIKDSELFDARGL